LVAAELARFDWQSFVDAAAYYDANITLPGGGTTKRFSGGGTTDDHTGLVFLNDASTADKVLEQIYLVCRSYVLERNGKLDLQRATRIARDADTG